MHTEQITPRSLDAIAAFFKSISGPFIVQISSGSDNLWGVDTYEVRKTVPGDVLCLVVFGSGHRYCSLCHTGSCDHVAAVEHFVGCTL